MSILDRDPRSCYALPAILLIRGVFGHVLPMLATAPGDVYPAHMLRVPRRYGRVTLTTLLLL
ncbi:hypothetical protein C8Q77DRAFT_161702 [Trametes polyzona]|nr:hypothetical protein C8Q77DRAFT_161702 [Trametes polyzona]